MTASSFDFTAGASIEATTLGAALSVRGSEACVGLPAPALSDQPSATDGSFLAIAAGRRRLIGVVTEVAGSDEPGAGRRNGAVARFELMNEITIDSAGVERFAKAPTGEDSCGDIDSAPKSTTPSPVASRLEQTHAQILKR